MTTDFCFLFEKNEKNEKCLELPVLARKLIRKSLQILLALHLEPLLAQLRDHDLFIQDITNLYLASSVMIPLVRLLSRVSNPFFVLAMPSVGTTAIHTRHTTVSTAWMPPLPSSATSQCRTFTTHTEPEGREHFIMQQLYDRVFSTMVILSLIFGLYNVQLYRVYMAPSLPADARSLGDRASGLSSSFVTTQELYRRLWDTKLPPGSLSLISVLSQELCCLPSTSMFPTTRLLCTHPPRSPLPQPPSTRCLDFHQQELFLATSENCKNNCLIIME